VTRSPSDTRMSLRSDPTSPESDLLSGRERSLRSSASIISARSDAGAGFLRVKPVGRLWRVPRTSCISAHPTFCISMYVVPPCWCLQPLLGGFGRGCVLARACTYLYTHCATFDSQRGRSHLFSASSSSATRCSRLASSASSGGRSWTFSHQLHMVCLRWGYCLHFFLSLRRRLGIVALQSAAAVIAVSYSLRAAVIWDRFRAASSTAAVTRGDSACSSSSRRSIPLVTSAALVRASSILAVTASSWRGIPSIMHVSRNSWLPL